MCVDATIAGGMSAARGSTDQLAIGDESAVVDDIGNSLANSVSSGINTSDADGLVTVRGYTVQAVLEDISDDDWGAAWPSDTTTVASCVALLDDIWTLRAEARAASTVTRCSAGPHVDASTLRSYRKRKDMSSSKLEEYEFLHAAEAHCLQCVMFFLEVRGVQPNCKSCNRNAMQWASKSSAPPRALYEYLTGKLAQSDSAASTATGHSGAVVTG